MRQSSGFSGDLDNDSVISNKFERFIEARLTDNV